MSQLAGSPNDPLDSHFSTLKMKLEQDFGLYYSIIGGEDSAGTFDLWKEREPTIGGHSGGWSLLGEVPVGGWLVDFPNGRGRGFGLLEMVELVIKEI